MRQYTIIYNIYIYIYSAHNTPCSFSPYLKSCSNKRGPVTETSSARNVMHLEQIWTIEGLLLAIRCSPKLLETTLKHSRRNHEKPYITKGLDLELIFSCNNVLVVDPAIYSKVVLDPPTPILLLFNLLKIAFIIIHILYIKYIYIYYIYRQWPILNCFYNHTYIIY